MLMTLNSIYRSSVKLNNCIRGKFTARIVDPVLSHLSQCSALLSITIVSQKGQLSDVGFTSDITILTRYIYLEK